MHACMHNCNPNPHAWQTNYNSQLQTSVQSLEHPIPSVDQTSFSSYYSNTLDVYIQMQDRLNRPNLAGHL